MRISFFFLFIVFNFSTQAQQKLASIPLSNNKFIVVSHRGNHVDVPENTIKSYENAIAIGADYIEIDLRTTKDISQRIKKKKLLMLFCALKKHKMFCQMNLLSQMQIPL